MSNRSAHSVQASSAQEPPAKASSAGASGGVITRSATVALFKVLNAMRDGWFLEQRLKNVARMIVDEAHRQCLDADQMLFALRKEWPGLLENRRVPGEVDLQMVAERLLSFCRVEFSSVPTRGLR